MKILAVDISLVFSMAWEASEGKEFSAAFNRTIANVTAARQGFDRCMLAIDSGPSFRKQCPEYKADRTDRGEAYREQLKRTIDRLVADGCVPVVAPAVGSFPLTDKVSYAEADDAIGWACAEYEKIVEEDGAPELWEFVILSDDSDLEQLVCDNLQISVLKSQLRGGEKWDEAKVTEKRGVPPEKIADMKALTGDDSDNYDGFCGELPEAAPGFAAPKRKPGIGPKGAASLIKAYGGALEIFDLTNLPEGGLPTRWAADGVPPAVCATLARHGRAQAEKGLFLARIVHSLPGLDFSVVLAEPAVKKIAELRSYDDAATPPPAIVGEPVEPNPAVAAQSTTLALRLPSTVVVTSNFDTLAFQPTSPQSLWKVAETLFNSRVYAQFPNVESVFACIFEARERGVSAGVALRNAYIVKGKLAWSAAFIVALVRNSGLARTFKIVETTMDKAVVKYQHVDDPEPALFEFTIAEATKAGWLKSGQGGDGKWITNPRPMLRWAALRESARFVWPEVVAGIFTPDERRNGVTEEGDYPEESAT